MEHVQVEKKIKKKPKNLSIRADLLQVAHDDRLNLSKMLEERLVDYCRKKSEKEWLEENKDGIEAYNERIERNGIFASRHRRF